MASISPGRPIGWPRGTFTGKNPPNPAGHAISAAAAVITKSSAVAGRLATTFAAGCIIASRPISGSPLSRKPRGLARREWPMADVCVIGAGPAGSTFAARMAQLGHRVHLIERQRFPRRHLGESLTPGVMTLLRAAGLHETIEAAGFPAVTGVWVKWPDGPKLREDTGAKGML